MSEVHTTHYYHERTETLIKIMGVLGILLALAGLFTGDIAAFVMLGALPLSFSILFMVTKKPIFGLLYTILFAVNRSNILLGQGLLLAWIITVGLLVFFSIVVYRSYVRGKHIKREQKAADVGEE